MPKHASLSSLAKTADWRGEDANALRESIQAGDRAAEKRLSDLRPTIEQALCRVLRNKPAELEDLTQITYERVIRTIGERRFEGRVELKAWAGAIAARVALEWLGRLTRERRLLGAVDAYSIFPPTYHALPERQMEARSEVRRLLGVIGRMKSKPATVLVLHDLLGHTVPEAAQILGINVSAAQTRLRRARVDFVKRCATDGSTLARAMR